MTPAFSFMLAAFGLLAILGVPLSFTTGIALPVDGGSTCI